MNTTHSAELFRTAQKYIPGGVNSPVRAFGAVGGTPIFFTRGEGAYLFDVDGNRYLDFVASWGPLILGHRHPAVLEAIEKTLRKGTSFGAPTEEEIALAQKVAEMVPSVECVRMVNSGTEATMTAIRLARALTERDKIVKFTGCYHGHADAFLLQAGSGVATLGIPGSPGVPKALAADTFLSPYNDLDALKELFRLRGTEIAAVIVEPIAGNMGTVPPQPGFLDGLRTLTQKSGSLLIFDEVITGFRVSEGGAQKLYGIQPDLTCLGKIIGGGLPVGAVGGSCRLLHALAPAGSVYQAGTLSGNPLAMAAGLATLETLRKEAVIPRLNRTAETFADALQTAIHTKGFPIQLNQVGSMFSLFFCEKPVSDFKTASQTNTALYARFFHKLLERGVYFPPSAFETVFLSAVMTQNDLQIALEAIVGSLEEIFQ